MSMKGALVGVCAAAVMAISAAGVVGVASAQEPDDDVTPTEGRFRERVAEKLGVAVEKLDRAIQDAALDAVNEAEAAGTITAEQATKARERIENGDGQLLFDRFREHRGARREHRQHIIRRAIVQSSAMALGLTPEELRAELQSGDSIADVAGEQSVSLDAVTAQITSDATAKLSEAVAAGRLKQQRADDAVARLTERLDEILNKSRERATP